MARISQLNMIQEDAKLGCYTLRIFYSYIFKDTAVSPDNDIETTES